MFARASRPTTASVTELAARLRNSDILVAPGVHDPLSALIAAQAGFEAVFVSGAALAMAQLGSPDVGLITTIELADHVARIADRVAVPVLVDGDQGGGNAAHVQRTVRMIERAGAAAIQIEDQLSVKPAAAIRARPLVTAGEMVGKISAALDARRDAKFLISARTDALSTNGFDDALDRADAYVEAGADMLFVEGVRDRAHADLLVDRFASRLPLVCNLLEGGGASFADAAEASAAGYSIALFPVTALGAAAQAMAAAYGTIARSGHSGAIRDRIAGLATLNDIVGSTAFAEAIATYGART